MLKDQQLIDISRKKFETLNKRLKIRFSTLVNEKKFI
jgi:hypothetical protein